MSSTKADMEALHKELTKVLRDRVKSDEVTAAELGVAAKFLKDNNVLVMPEKDEELQGLQDELAERRRKRKEALTASLESLGQGAYHERH